MSNISVVLAIFETPSALHDTHTTHRTDMLFIRGVLLYTQAEQKEMKKGNLPKGLSFLIFWSGPDSVFKRSQLTKGCYRQKGGKAFSTSSGGGGGVVVLSGLYLYCSEAL